MTQVEPSVQVETHARFSGGLGSFPVKLMWWESDPYAALLRVPIQTLPPDLLPDPEFDGEEFLDWWFHRDLLRDGLYHSVGEHRVMAKSAGTGLFLTVSNPENSGTFRLSWNVVRQFVERIYKTVPEGMECLSMNIDRELRELFDAAD